MTKERIKDYTLRVTQASPCELVIILYDIILDDIAAAKTSAEENDMAAYRKELTHAGKFLNELMGVLDFSVPLSYHLMSLYIYANKMLTKARVSGNAQSLADVTMIMEKLRAGFEGIKSQDTTGPVMQNVQQVYAGLTYGRGQLNEAFLNPQDYNRGFNA